MLRYSPGVKVKVAPWLFATVLSLFGCGDPASPPALSFEASTVVFPDSVIDRVATGGVKALSLTNSGGDAATPTLSLTNAADFTIERTTCNALAPGASCAVVVRFEPHTLGARTADLVASFAESSVAVTLVGSALTEPGLSSNPTSQLHYGDVAIGATKTLQLTLRNGSAVIARPYAVGLAGANVGDFAIVADTCSGSPKQPNATCKIDVTFTPSVTSPRSAQLVVSSANLGDLMIALDGSGFRPAELAVSPGTGAFGSVFVHDASLAHSFTVTNSGTLPSPALEVSISGADASLFELTDGCSGSSLAGGGSCVFSIRYHASTIGMHTAAAMVIAPPLSLVVPLTGTGEPAQIQLTPPGWDFGNVLVGQTTATKTLTVNNIGSTNTGPLGVGIGLPSSAVEIVEDGCTGVDLAPGAICTFGVRATAVARDLNGAMVIVATTRGDSVDGVVQVEGVIAVTGNTLPAPTLTSTRRSVRLPLKTFTTRSVTLPPS